MKRESINLKKNRGNFFDYVLCEYLLHLHGFFIPFNVPLDYNSSTLLLKWRTPNHIKEVRGGTHSKLCLSTTEHYVTSPEIIKEVLH